MENKVDFDLSRNLMIQSKAIEERIKLFDKLYLEVGDKLFDILNKLEMGLCDEATYDKLQYLKNKCSINDSSGAKALNCLGQPKNSKNHSTYIITGNDELNVKELNINLSCENELLKGNWAKVCYIILIILFIFILFYLNNKKQYTFNI